MKYGLVLILGIVALFISVDANAQNTGRCEKCVFETYEGGMTAECQEVTVVGFGNDTCRIRATYEPGSSNMHFECQVGDVCYVMDIPWTYSTRSPLTRNDRQEAVELFPVRRSR